ncbi:MAG: DDE-type integrase/transposase/recombinase [Paracoccaceae bacterium]|nr:DDE-type integrase/transposase/recombinase [Paracoccaceae bacterium]
MWRAIDANGQLVDFRLAARRDAKTAKAFFKGDWKIAFTSTNINLHRQSTSLSQGNPRDLSRF